jgi:hypothetical protein
LARYDGKLTAAGESAFDAAELLAALGAQAAVSRAERQEAIVRYLSASDGWLNAGSLLGGAFANDGQAAAPSGPELMDKKEG